MRRFAVVGVSCRWEPWDWRPRPLQAVPALLLAGLRSRGFEPVRWTVSAGRSRDRLVRFQRRRARP